MIARRILLSAAALVPTGAVRAADPARIALVFFGSPAVNADQQAAFRRGLARLGLAERNAVTLEIYHLDGDAARLPALAEAIVRSAPRVIVASPTATVVGLRRATTTIPIVLATGGDPVAAGLAASLARPGGNVTGLSSQAADLVEKQLALLHEALPGARRVLVIRAPSELVVAAGTTQEAFSRAAARLGLAAEAVEFRGAEDIERVRAAILARRPDAIFTWADPILQFHRHALTALGNGLGVPTIGPFRSVAEAGGLASYGADMLANWERAAWFADRILKGGNPAEMPIEQPTRFELVVNLRTARALDIAVPPAILAQADEVIE